MATNCSQCGAPMPPDARFCGECGAALSAVVPVIQDAPTQEAPSVQSVVSAGGRASKKRSRRQVAIVGGVVGVLALTAGAVAILFATGFFGPHGLAINEEAFPDEVIRAAVIAQVDTDGDGELSAEEQQAVTGFVAGDGRVSFVLNGEEVDPGAILGSAEGDSAEDTADEGENATVGEDASEKTGALEEGSDSESDADDGTDSVEEGRGEAAEGQTETPWGTEGFDAFPNLKTIVVRDAGLTELDLSVCPNVEYVDCRQNPLASLNLAGNANLTTLFCDDNVPLEGLDEAGLYFTDLIASAQELDTATEEVNDVWVVEYDTFGRPIRVNTWRGAERTYEYDEQGRLTGAQWDASDWEKYTYRDNGLLESCENFFTLDVDSKDTFRTAFGYDKDGRLAQTQMSHGDQGVIQRKSFKYDDGRPSACLFENGDANGSERGTFEFDESGRLVGARFYEEESGFQELSDDLIYEYDECGLLVYGNATRLWDSEYGGTDRHGEYNEQGHPLWARIVPGNPQASCVDFDYSCNIDGYVTRMHTYKPDYDRDIQLEISYIKMVGSLEDRPARRFVPQFSVGFGIDGHRNGGSAFTMGQEWGQDTASSLDATVQEVGPVQMVYQTMGLMPRTLSNPNELRLAAYDAEHWTDGLRIDEASLLFEQQDLTADSAPEVGSFSDVQTEDFAFNLPESWKDQVEVMYNEPYEEGIYSVNVMLRGSNVALLTASTIVPLEDDVEEGDAYYLRLATVPLEDGRQLIVDSTAWAAILYYCMGSGTQAMEGVTPNQWEDIISLTLDGQSSYDEIANAPQGEDASLSALLIALQREYLTEEIADKIVLA
ncbi:hypothetical protein E5332_02305 [Enterorhabdus sp. NM05_H27]|nr:hypothetical protein E5332_02305 [Enterorhabdus sp. NM05_H27]